MDGWMDRSFRQSYELSPIMRADTSLISLSSNTHFPRGFDRIARIFVD